MYFILLFVFIICCNNEESIKIVNVFIGFYVLLLSKISAIF